MNVTDRLEISDGYSIEWGEATWDQSDASVRNRYETASGGFSPRSSSELPIGDLEYLVIHSAERRHLAPDLMQRMAHALIDALARDKS